LTRINDTLLDQLGFTREEVVGHKKLEDLLTVGSRIFFQTHFYPLIKMQKKANEIFLSFLTRERLEIPVLLNVALYENGADFEIHCGGMQISQRNRFEKELLEAKRIAENALNENLELIEIRNQLQLTQRNLELQLRNLSGKNADQAELSKVLSHDLQEPLRKISLYSSRLLYLQNSDLSQESVNALTRIMEFVVTVRQLLDGLEKFNSLDYEKVRFSPVNIAEAILAAENYSRLTDDNVSITLVHQQDAPIVFYSDFKLIVSLLNELIADATKFRNPRNKTLNIKITTDVISANIFTQIKGKYLYEDCLRLTLEDDGIARHVSERNAFELFRRSDSNNDELGIGLAYCRRIVQLLNGRIAVASNGHSGTIFTVTFPLQAAYSLEIR
jgi:phosphoserine phosphatase RsbU/P